MRKWLWIGAASVMLGGAAVCLGCWYLQATRLSEYLGQVVGSQATPQTTPSTSHDNGESCELFEPLTVEGSDEPAPPTQAVADVGPMPRVVLLPGMVQPPRPDGEPGKVARMPYADEDEDTGSILDPLVRILQAALPRWELFGESAQTTPTEEPESKSDGNSNAAVPAEPEPMPDAATDYHQQYQHCPYTGAYCPYRR